MRILMLIVCAMGFAGATLVTHAQESGATAPSPVAEPSKPRVIRISTGVLAAQRLKGDNPAYPAEAKRKGIEGTVTLSIVVGPDGHIESVNPYAGPEELWAAATDAVKTWTYKPYILNGEPVEVHSTVLVSFHLTH